VCLFRSLLYRFIFIQIFLTAFFFQARGTFLQRWLYNSNFISYVLYCLLTWERDFIFPLFSIFLHVNVLRGGTFWGVAKIGSIAAAAASLGTWLFLVRGDHAVGELGISILNQGSLLFVNTYFLQLLEEGVGPFYGFTYWNALLNLFPHWIVSTDFNTLSWFHAQYAPRGESGYGFGLDAEAYLNFGVSGVVCVFLVLGSFQRFVFNRIGKSSFYLYFSVFFTGFLMYSLRNDSLALIKGSIYAILFFWLIIIASVVLRRVGRRREWSLQFETGDRLQSQDT
jgi:hypothetical protein